MFFSRLLTRSASQQSTRSFVSRTSTKRGGGGGHGDDHHHNHSMWEKRPFAKGPSFMLTFGILIIGSTALNMSGLWQQTKNGFIKK